MSDWDPEDTAAGYRTSRDDGGAVGNVRKKVLLVDDSETVLMMERMVLSRAPYQLMFARDGEQAVETALRERPDLILLDVMMPRMNGFEACRTLRQHEAMREVPIILVTTRSEGENVEAGYENGCTDYVNKPFNGPELLAKLKSFLGV
jgi:DNA-binding response OmpR family regulator